MPWTNVVLFKEGDDAVPFLEWLTAQPQKCQAKCLYKIERLRQEGHELRRPEADYLRDGIYELRITLRRINYRVLYFFHGTEAVVISHGLMKEKDVPPSEIDKAIERKRAFVENPMQHTFTGVLPWLKNEG